MEGGRRKREGRRGGGDVQLADDIFEFLGGQLDALAHERLDFGC